MAGDDIFSEIDALSDDEAEDTLAYHRWGDDMYPTCPGCGSTRIARIVKRRRFRCKNCRTEFSVTTGTPMAWRKLSHRQLLKCIILSEDCFPDDDQIVCLLGVHPRSAAGIARMIELIRKDTKMFHWKRED